MSRNLRLTSEKLYLYKGKDESEDIFVESALHQHHIDGIRFIYKQFKRKKPGIILNNPLGYGNSLQVALFVGAIQHLLKKPILILCEDGEEYNWLELFQKHTQCCDVVVNAPSAFTKKSIFINNIDSLEVFTRRAWSILVVDNDSSKMKSTYNKFDSDYKIWITPVDMKDNLQIFCLIYKWIYPKEKFNADDFKSQSGNRKDIITKTILLTTFFEDIVFRTKLLTPFENPFENKVKTQQRVTEKNKDSTGTKIKRSKRIAEDLDNRNHTNFYISAIKIPKVNNSESSIDKDSTSVSDLSRKSDARNSDVMDIDDKHSVLDVEDFISSKEPIKDHMHDFDNISNDSEDSKLVLHYESDTMLSEAEVPVHCSFNISTKSENHSSNEKTLDQEITMSPESEDNAYELETQEFLNDNNMDINDSDNKKNNIDEEYSIVEKSLKIDENIASDTVEEISDSNQDISNENELEKEKPMIELPKDNRVEQKETEGSQNTKTKTLDIDNKITELEDRIFKKFKGTFLDSIF